MSEVSLFQTTSDLFYTINYFNLIYKHMKINIIKNMNINNLRKNTFRYNLILNNIYGNIFLNLIIKIYSLFLSY